MIVRSTVMRSRGTCFLSWGGPLLPAQTQGAPPAGDLAKWLDLLADPVEDLREAKFAAIHRAIDKLVPCSRIDFDVETVAPQEDVGGSEGDPLLAVEEAPWLLPSDSISAAASSSSEL